MKALWVDLRRRVVDALQSGQARRHVAERFCVCLASLGRLARQGREQGHLQPRPIPGRPRAVRASEQATLGALVAADKDATLPSLSAALERETGRRISTSALQRNLRWLDNTHKESRPQQGNPTPRNAPPSGRE